MGATDHGTQTISHQYYQEMTALLWNKRLLNVIPRGVYSGGKLTRVSDIEVTLSSLVVEIGDSVSQVCVRTTTSITINDSTLDSGTISSATPYIVLRWSYTATAVNYMEVHAVASVSENDVVVGKIEFSGSVITGFDYSDRTFPKILNLFLEPLVSTGMYITVNSGVIHTDTAYKTVEMQEVGPFVAPSSPNSRIDLVYIDDNGVAQILQGTAAVSPTAPNYGGKLVVAEVTVVNGDTSIPASRIRDVRAFVSKRGVSDASLTISKLAVYDSGWFSASIATNYTKAHGLGTTPKFVFVYYSSTADGSGDVVLIGGGLDYLGGGRYHGVATVIGLDASNIVIRGQTHLCMYYSQSGTLTRPTSGYLKVVAF